MTKRIVVISDTHNSHEEIDVPHGDILLHCGDWSGVGSLQELISLNQWFGTLGFQDIVVIAGNHDRFAEASYSTTKQLFTNAHYIQDEMIEVQGLKIYGSPYTKEYGAWYFMRTEERLIEVWDKIPDDIDILMTHGPAHGILDYVPRGGGDHAGSVTLGDAILNRIQPKLHAFGHIHCAYGQTQRNSIKFVNAACLDDWYMPVNKPIEVVL